MSRYPDNWNQIAFAIKARAGWRCSKCGMQCIRPGEQVKGLTISERRARTLQVHHWNRDPSDNRPENLAPLCSGCHLSFHNLGQANVLPGQLSLF